MNIQPPAAIDEMQVRYYATVAPYKAHLKKYMPEVPHFLVLVYYPDDKSYCILGTDERFQNWERYTNYVFKDVQAALEFPDTIFRLPDDFKWIKI